MKTIYLTASNLAKLTGHNKYEDPQKTLDIILNSNNIVKKYIPKSNLEESLIKLEPEKLENIKKVLNINTEISIPELDKVIKKRTSKAYSKNIKESESKDIIDNTLKKLNLEGLNESMKHDIRMSRGNIKENNNLNIIQSKKNIKINQRNSKIYAKDLYNDPNNIYKIIIRGKIDGISDNAIVETKNRTKRLFNVIPDYEKVQLESYMFLTDFNKCIHIEHYNDEENMTDYSKNIEFWEDCKRKIINYIDINIKPLLI